MLNMLVDDANSIPTYLVKGRTVLNPKEECHGRQKQYHTIACLNTK